MRVVAALLALSLAACGGGRREVSEPEPPEWQACRREARDSREYRDVFRAQNPERPWELRDNLRTTEARMMRVCLEEKGLARFGVEQVQPLR
jgi:hypothetical protein